MDKAIDCYEKAIEFYEKGLPLFDRRDKDYSAALANYGMAVAKTGNKKKAAECINQAERMGYAYASKARKAAGLSLFSKFF